MRDSALASLAIGFFDGVHIGHRKILSGVRRAITFREHPLKVLAPERLPPMLMSWEDRERAIRECGVEEVIALDFTPDLAAMPAVEFARRYLDGVVVRCGGNWSFGRGGRDNAETLRAMGYTVQVEPYAMYEGEPVSSTRIRKALMHGDAESAAKMLGRPWRLRGTVVAGKGEGSKLGYPTVNIVPDPMLVRLPAGVYECRYLCGRAICNFGMAPTFGERAWTSPVCEVHRLETGVAGGDTDAVEIVRFIRPERRFADAQSLKAQIAKDIDGIL